MDAYVFIRSAPDEALEHLKELAADDGSDIRFATALTGAHDALVAVSSATFESLERTVKHSIRGAGASGTDTAVVVMPIPMPMPKWSPPQRYEAFVQCRVKRGKARGAMESLMEIPGAMGVAMVAGSFDLLFEVGGETFEQVTDSLLRMHETEGLRWSRSSLCSFPDA